MGDWQHPWCGLLRHHAACPADSENPGGAPERQQREKLAPNTKTMHLTIIKNNYFPANETTYP